MQSQSPLNKKTPYVDFGQNPTARSRAIHVASTAPSSKRPIALGDDLWHSVDCQRSQRWSWRTAKSWEAWLRSCALRSLFWRGRGWNAETKGTSGRLWQIKPKMELQLKQITNLFKKHILMQERDSSKFPSSMTFDAKTRLLCQDRFTHYKYVKWSVAMLYASCTTIF